MSEAIVGPNIVALAVRLSPPFCVPRRVQDERIEVVWLGNPKTEQVTIFSILRIFTNLPKPNQPMLIVRRGSEGTDTPPQEASSTALTQMFVNRPRNREASKGQRQAG